MATVRLAALPLGAALLLIPGLLLSGCGSGSSDKYAPNAEEAKMVKEAENLSPEQQIANVEKAPISQAMKDAQIKAIKEKAGIQ
ncbi:hypothetical protein EON79_09290 [bacterium]|nr:MAG: hypothetical protein EON79_09290 [bacterium]